MDDSEFHDDKKLPASLVVAACSMSHVWWTWNGLECCKVCGIVKRRDGKNRPCRGQVKVGPR